MIKSETGIERRTLVVRRVQTGMVMVAQTCHSDERPFVHPLSSPDGVGTLTENQPAHHPWQHGLYVGLNDVNGHGFWCEGRLASHQRDGTFHPTPIQVLPSSDPSEAAWTFDCAFRGHEGQPLLTETQRWTFRDDKDSTRLDLTWTLRADVDVRFGQYSYGGLFLRMPFRKEVGASVLNSEGASTVIDTEKKRARWVAVGMPIPDRESISGINPVASVAMMDHPSNPEHPVPWRVDDQYGIAPSRCIAGAWTLAQGESIQFRHRVLTLVGQPDARVIEPSYSDFAERTQ